MKNKSLSFIILSFFIFLSCTKNNIEPNPTQSPEIVWDMSQNSFLVHRGDVGISETFPLISIFKNLEDKHGNNFNWVRVETSCMSQTNNIFDNTSASRSLWDIYNFGCGSNSEIRYNDQSIYLPPSQLINFIDNTINTQTNKIPEASIHVEKTTTHNSLKVKTSVLIHNIKDTGDLLLCVYVIEKNVPYYQYGSPTGNCLHQNVLRAEITMGNPDRPYSAGRCLNWGNNPDSGKVYTLETENFKQFSHTDPRQIYWPLSLINWDNCEVVVVLWQVKRYGFMNTARYINSSKNI